MENKKVKKQVRKTKGAKGKIVPLHTKRKEAEEALWESEEKFRTLFEGLIDGLVAVNSVGNVLFANEAAAQNLGYDLKEFLQLNITDIEAKETKEEFEKHFSDMLKGERLRFETVHRKKDGSLVDVDVSLNVAHLRGKKVTYSIWRDITERKRAEEALQESEEKYRDLFEYAGDALFIMDDRFRFLECNNHTLKLFGCKSREQIIRKTPDVFSPEIQPDGQPSSEKARKLTRLVMEGKPQQFEWEHYRLDNKKPFWVSVSLKRIKIKDNYFMQAVVQDITKRKKAEEALCERETMLQSIFRAAPTGIGLVSNRILLWVNERFCEMVGYSAEEMIGKNARMLYPSDEDYEYVGREKYAQISSKGTGTVETRFRRKDGTIIDILLSSTALEPNDPSGRVTFTALDITERKQAEEALRESEEKYRAIFEQAADSIVLVDGETGALLEFNERALENLGYTREEFRRLKIPDFEVIESAEEVAKHIEKIIREGADTFETKHRRKDGQIRNIVVSSRAISIGGKDFVQSIWRDITERKQAEEALRKSEEKYRTLTESSITGVFIHQDGRYVFVNDRFAEIHGYKAEELLGKEYWRLIYPDDRGVIAKIVSKRLGGKEAPEHYEVRRLSKNGQTIWCEMMAARIEYRGRSAIMGNIIDITKRKQAAEEVERLAKFPSENPNPVLRISSNGLILYSNKAALPLLKAWDCRRKDQILSGRWYQYIADALGSGGDQQAEVECGKRIFSLTFAPVADSNYVNVYALDITKRKRAEEKLLDDKKQLRSLTSELSLTEERERRCIAEGLHDSIIQPLVFLDIKLDSLKKSAKQRGLIDSLDEMRTTIGELIEMTRGFTFDLSSSVVYELGIEAAIEEWLTTNVREKYAIATIFEDDGQSKPLDDDMRAFLFKAVRELLINVVKHAGAGSVKVSAARDEDKIKICVEDDGAGFEYLKKKAGLSGSSGYGLFSIRERLHYLGGSFDIESKLGHGTRVALTAPLKCDS